MTRAAIIENGIVTNIILADEEYAISIGAIPCDETIIIGSVYELGEFVPPEFPEIDIDILKKSLKETVDSLAELERLKYITLGSGQAMTYQTKLLEAKMYLVSGGELEQYPFLSAELGITGETLEQVAQVIVNMNNQWVIIGSEIERIRLDAKKNIDLSTTIQEANSYVPNFAELINI